MITSSYRYWNGGGKQGRLHSASGGLFDVFSYTTERVKSTLALVIYRALVRY